MIFSISSVFITLCVSLLLIALFSFIVFRILKMGQKSADRI